MNHDLLSPRKKGPSRALLYSTKSLVQPRLNCRSAVLRLPFLERFVIATLGFYDLAVVRFFINLSVRALRGRLVSTAAGALRLTSRIQFLTEL